MAQGQPNPNLPFHRHNALLNWSLEDAQKDFENKTRNECRNLRLAYKRIETELSRIKELLITQVGHIQ